MGFTASNDVYVKNCFVKEIIGEEELAVGFYCRVAERVSITDSTAQNIFSTKSDAAGFAFEGCKNVEAKNNLAQLSKTVSADASHSAAGFLVDKESQNVDLQELVAQDMQSASGTSAGFLVRDSSDVSLSNSLARNAVSSGSTGNGLELKGAGTTNVNVSESKFFANQDNGVLNSTGNDQFYEGNTAENNPTAYSGVSFTPVVYTKSTGTFSATPNKWSNISVVA